MSNKRARSTRRKRARRHSPARRSPSGAPYSHREHLPSTRVPFWQLASAEGRILFAVVLIMVVVFPPLFLGDSPGASIRRAFLWGAAAAALVTTVGVVMSSRPQPGGRPPAPPPVAAGSLAGISILLIALLPVPFLAVAAGLAEGFFLACLLFWVIDFYRFWRWRRFQAATRAPQ